MQDEHTPGTDSGNSQDQLIQGHSYDGIQEYDNPMPGWWVWIFIGTAIFAVYYVLGINVFGFINTYEEDLDESLTQLATIRSDFAATQPAFVVDEETIGSYVGDEAKISAGAASYATVCAACHGDVGQGLIGPNLTDEYWIKGNTNVDIYTIITQGSLEKGMPPWEGAFSPEQRAELVAFVRSLEGTDPPNAKAPEGEKIES